MGEAKRSGLHAAAPLSAALLVLFAMLGGFPRESLSEGLSGYVEYSYAENKTNSVDAGGRSSRTESDSLSQSYNLTLDKRIYPKLKFFASGIFRRTDSTAESDGVETDSTATVVRPFVSLGLRTPLYRADIAISRNEEKVKRSGSPSLTTMRDLAYTSLYWKPDRSPDLKVNFSREHLYDKDRAVADTVTDLFHAASNYRPVEALTLYYQGTYRDTELRLSGTRTEEISHNGRANYSNTWGRRITFGADYNIRHQTLDTETTGTGEVGVPVYPFLGLSALSDTPDNVALLPNPALVDGNFSAGTGINLGLPPPGGDTRARNMGLDFAVATEINTLYVWVDRDVTQVADAFTWRIYTSGDNLNWILRQTIAPAVYSPTYNRFEIRFLNIRDRYVKVVVLPLTLGVPFASSFPDIQVVELQAEVRRSAAEVAGRQTSTFHTGSADFRAVLLESIGLTYDLSYFFTKRDPGDLAYSASTGLSFFRQFNRVFSGNGRVAFEHGENQKGGREAFLLTASVTAVPIPTVFQSLTVSGKKETSGGEKNSEVSLLLYNNLKLYEGIDANLSVGIGLREDDAGERNRTSQVNAGLTFIPNRKVTMSMYYNGTNSVSSGGDLEGETETYTHAGEASLTITPVQTLYLFGSYRVEQATSIPRRDILNYSLNWSPFPDGTLHFTFYYNETIRSDDLKDRSIGPGLRWYFTPRSSLQLAYLNTRSEASAQTSTSETYSGTVRVNF